MSYLWELSKKFRGVFLVPSVDDWGYPTGMYKYLSMDYSDGFMPYKVRHYVNTPSTEVVRLDSGNFKVVEDGLVEPIRFTISFIMDVRYLKSYNEEDSLGDILNKSLSRFIYNVKSNLHGGYLYIKGFQQILGYTGSRTSGDVYKVYVEDNNIEINLNDGNPFKIDINFISYEEPKYIQDFSIDWGW